MGRKTIDGSPYTLIASMEYVGGIYKHVQQQVIQRKKSFSTKDFENAEYLVEIISYKNKPKGVYKRPSLISLTPDETKKVLTISIEDFVKFQVQNQIHNFDYVKVLEQSLLLKMLVVKVTVFEN